MHDATNVYVLHYPVHGRHVSAAVPRTAGLTPMDRARTRRPRIAGPVVLVSDPSRVCRHVQKQQRQAYGRIGRSGSMNEPSLYSAQPCLPSVALGVWQRRRSCRSSLRMVRRRCAPGCTSTPARAWRRRSPESSRQICRSSRRRRARRRRYRACRPTIWSPSTGRYCKPRALAAVDPAILTALQ